MPPVFSKLHDLIYMTRDFVRVVRGKDYFHEPARLGHYFEDSRCYYYDFSTKVDWNGPLEEGVPVLFVPAWSKFVPFPIMIMQFGLGALERYFFKEDYSQLRRIHEVTRWLNKHIGQEGGYDNLFPDLHPQHRFYSSNSALAQGHALSFLSRVCRYNLAPPEWRGRTGDLLNRVFLNMVRPIEAGGTSLIRGPDVSFCEICRKDDYVVLNGWIYALFGLLDYHQYRSDVAGLEILHASLRTLERKINDYFLPDGWSFYDNLNRVSSPVYHASHVVLLDAMWRLTGFSPFERSWRWFLDGNSLMNRLKYTLRKVADKVFDRQVYLTR